LGSGTRMDISLDWSKGNAKIDANKLCDRKMLHFNCIKSVKKKHTIIPAITFHYCCKLQILICPFI
jgi:hypothetical protein